MAIVMNHKCCKNFNQDEFVLYDTFNGCHWKHTIISSGLCIGGIIVELSELLSKYCCYDNELLDGLDFIHQLCRDKSPFYISVSNCGINVGNHPINSDNIKKIYYINGECFDDYTCTIDFDEIWEVTKED